ncbi:MAG TPA: gephyrin-like molybdotransferase Glp [Stellaceae bacterium]|nr:gephyrin-like molybdotransferase Glp [Stellaceae bacterium]
MAQLSDDCFAFGGELLSMAAALDLIGAKVAPVVERETTSLSAALGRILAAPVTAPHDVPPHDNSAVDGYAVRFDDLAPGEATLLPVKGRAAAGHPLEATAARGAAVRIFTGAPMPAGLDTVLMQEDCEELEASVRIPPGIKRGANRRHAGEDVKAGATVLRAGQRLRAQDIGLAASLGFTALEVYRRLRVAIFSTGDEVRDPGATLPPGAIYDANRFLLRALLEGLGAEVTDLGILPDRRERIAAALAEGARGHDLLLTSGGVSTGEEDHVKAAVEAQGRLHFWRLAIKPGRPVAMGQVGRIPFMGLPGNPVAVMVTFLILARPLVLKLSGAEAPPPRRFRVVAGFDYKKRSSRCEYVRARLEPGEDGGWVARKFPRDGAGILSSMVDSDGLAEIGEGISRVEPGMSVAFIPFSEVLA